MSRIPKDLRHVGVENNDYRILRHPSGEPVRSRVAVVEPALTSKTASLGGMLLEVRALLVAVKPLPWAAPGPTREPRISLPLVPWHDFHHRPLQPVAMRPFAPVSDLLTIISRQRSDDVNTADGR